ncbi:hypothetical protein B296_00015284 [Ensete ventricosum]|uniref:Uncharacterized protein n=1 Tax=Ensete ventricosum TaxID=4639 RepID=A0A427AK70_ENSVE|nr:hypothetical protein B296_00015284 [Ensete ventricosum]
MQRSSRLPVSWTSLAPVGPASAHRRTGTPAGLDRLKEEAFLSELIEVPVQVSSKNPTFERLKATLVRLLRCSSKPGLGGGAGENAEGSTFPGLGRFPAFALPGLWPRAGSSFASALSPRCVAADGPAVASPLVFWSSTLHLFCFFFIPALPCFAFGLQWIWLVEGNGDDVEAGGGGGFGGGTAAVGNPDDAAQENSGKGVVEPCICLVQSGRACNPNMGLFFLSLSCI